LRSLQACRHSAAWNVIYERLTRIAGDPTMTTRSLDQTGRLRCRAPVARNEGELMSSFVRYIDRTRDYYLSKGYDKPYQWAHFEDVPFTPLTKPLSESRVVLVTTSDIAAQGVDQDRDETVSVSMGGHYSIPSDLPIDRYYSDSHGFDRHATTLEDVGAFFPLARLREAVEAGRVAGITRRVHNVCTAYSQRRTREQDAPEVLRRCREDGADVAILTPV